MNEERASKLTQPVHLEVLDEKERLDRIKSSLEERGLFILVPEMIASIGIISLSLLPG